MTTQTTATTAAAAVTAADPALADRKQVIVDFVAALNGGLDADWSRYLAANVVDHNQIIFGEEDAPGAAVEGFRQQLAAFSLSQEGDGFRIEQLLGEGEDIVARIRVAGVHSGFHPRMPEPTGRHCDVEQIWIFTVRDGRISEIRAVSDRLGMFIQLGWDWPTAG